MSGLRLAMRAVLVSAGLLSGVGASPQAGAVTGQLSLLERQGRSRRDVATAVIYLEAIDGRADDDRGSVSTEATIAMRGREFQPHRAVIRSGGAVHFPNQDPFSHNVFSNTDPVNFDLGLYRRGASRTATFDQPGVYPIYCNIHAKMVSYVIAVPGRFVTFAGADGRFEIADVPVGSYRLHVWHERAAHLTRELVVSATGASVLLELDARGRPNSSHANKFGMPYTSTRGDRY